MWSDILFKMIFPFDYTSNPDSFEDLDIDVLNEKMKEGLELFAKYFEDL